ncbi:DUF2513 domain-containing protein [Vibrio vulnificus]|nr:DUF2513 domain-containing protein [Vibrio vulnificus]RZQ42921.1 DUF2513 domain-containing protein [Vibrio vulnificus]
MRHSPLNAALGIRRKLVKRDWELIRDILLKVEELTPDEEVCLCHFDEGLANQVSYHVKLLEQAGILDVLISRGDDNGAADFFIRSLTWSGHEFLDAIRPQSIFTQVIDKITSEGRALTFDVIKNVAVSLSLSGIA